MASSRQCPSCRSVLEEGDRFCPSCGRAVPAEPPAGRGSPCPLCGQENPPEAASCSSCGAKLRDPAPGSRAPAAAPAPSKGIATFQSWKFTLGVAAVLVVALVVLVNVGKGPGDGAAPAGAQQADPHNTPEMNRIRELQAHLEKDPTDAPATLEAANLLYDVHFYDRAASMYDRYLAMEPGNADARVDMGTSYFNLSLSDSAHGRELAARAESCFVRAIETQPKHQLAHFNLGIVHLQRGDVAGAKKWFERCAAIDSTSEPGRRARQLISEHLQVNPPSSTP